MLIAILNTCSKEELQEDTPGSLTGPSSPPLPNYDPESTEFKRRAIKNKILAIGRLSRVFQVLREEAEHVTELKTRAGGRLPAGTLMLGSEGIKQAIHSFEEARKVDLQNERLPPSQDEVRRSMDQTRTEALQRAEKDNWLFFFLGVWITHVDDDIFRSACNLSSRWDLDALFIFCMLLG